MILDIGWPQAIYILLMTMGIAIAIDRFGQTRTRTYDWTDVFLGPAITLGLIYWGGFFG